jgi:hypothetical protein
MADLEQKTNQLSQNSATVAAEMPAAEPKKENSTEKSSKKPFKSAGWKIHNELTYRGLDFFLNATIGVTFSYWAARTASGKKYFTKPVIGFFEKLLRPILSTPKAIHEGSKWGSNFVSILVGGMTIIPPMMLMENKKIKKGMVQGLDEMIYGKEKVENDPKFAEAYRAIDDEPKKGFWVGLGTRFLALAPLLALTVWPTTNKYLVTYLYEPIGKVSKGVFKVLNIQPRKMIEGYEMIHPHGNIALEPVKETHWEFLHKNIGFDFGLSFIYAFVHEGLYKSFSGVRKKTDEKTAAPSAIVTVANTGANTSTTNTSVVEASQDQPAGTFASKISKVADVVGRQPITPRDRATDFADKTNQKVQAAL